MTCRCFAITLASLALCACTTMQPMVTNQLGMQMVLLPAGEFTMGNEATLEQMAELYPQYERKRLQDLVDETPAHRVRITHPFYMERHEVTVGQFRRFLAASSGRKICCSRLSPLTSACSNTSAVRSVMVSISRVRMPCALVTSSSR